jgi:hypothetical protein
MLQRYLLLLSLILAMPAQAAIYKYVDADGNITFTDRYRPGAVKLVDTRDDAGSAGTPARKPNSGRLSSSPANFPKVDSGTQRRRDDVRRSLLLEERTAEQSALAGVRAALGDGKKRSAPEQTRLIESQRLHEKNIEMLDKELARIK